MIAINSEVCVRAKFTDEACRQTQRIDIDQRCTTEGYKNNLCHPLQNPSVCGGGAPASNDAPHSGTHFFPLRRAKLPGYRLKFVQKESGLRGEIVRVAETPTHFMT